jgi:expansin (peptidoglycan-binding protein)
MSRVLLPALMALLPGCLAANEMRVDGTPLLSASLPAGTTWQVESSQAGGPWTATGVLLAGTAAPVAARLDGFPADAAYRCVRLDGKFTVLPEVTRGLHLAGTTDQKQVRIDASPDLAAWSQAAVVLPDIDGHYLRAVREPLAARGFFRSEVPGLPLEFACVTFYDADPALGAAGFGPVVDDMPAFFQNGFTAAVPAADFHRGGINAGAAGECYELAGPLGSTTVMISDLAPDVPPSIASSGRKYMDLGQPAFAAIADTASGIATLTRRLVPAPVTGNVKLLVVQNVGGFFTELRPYNHRAGINTLEIKPAASSTWTTLPRTTYNSFQYSGSALTFPLSVRLTSRFGETVNFAPILSLATGDRITGPAQFAVFPQQAPQPVWLGSPVYRDGNDGVPGDAWTASGDPGVTLITGFIGEIYEGSASLRIDGLAAFRGVNFDAFAPVARPEIGVLEFATRSGTATVAESMGIVIQGFTAGGAAVTSATIELPPLTATWQLFRIPLGTAGIPAKLSRIRLACLSAEARPPLLMDRVMIVPH